MNKPASELIALADEFDGEAKANYALGDKDEARKCELAAQALRTTANQSGSERAGVDALREALEDCKTHREAWRGAITNNCTSFGSDDDGSYWDHELSAFDRTFAALATPPAQPAPAATHGKPDDGPEFRDAIDRAAFGSWFGGHFNSEIVAEVDRLRKASEDHQKELKASHGKPDGALRSQHDKLHLFLSILDRAGGETSGNDDKWNWINYFCDDAAPLDTFNQASKRGLTRVTHDVDNDNSVVYLTDAGRAFVAALHSPKIAAAETSPGDVLAMKEACVRICLEEAAEWDSDNVQTLKNYAGQCANRIDRLDVKAEAKSQEPDAGQLSVRGFREDAFRSMEVQICGDTRTVQFGVEDHGGDHPTMPCCALSWTDAADLASWVQSALIHPTTRPEAPAVSVDAIIKVRSWLATECCSDPLEVIDDALIAAGITEVPCPECNGAGEWDEGPLPATSSTQISPDYRQVKCPECNGSGRAALGVGEMARTSKHHHELTNGVGKCSVPMWMGGCPSGFCDKPAYGPPVPSKMFRNAWTGEMVRLDGRYNGYAPGLACVGHGGPQPTHFGDPCVHCDTPHDDVPAGPCKPKDARS